MFVGLFLPGIVLERRTRLADGEAGAALAGAGAKSRCVPSDYFFLEGLIPLSFTKGHACRIRVCCDFRLTCGKRTR